MKENRSDQWDPTDPGDQQHNETSQQNEGYPNEGGDSDSETNYDDKPEKEISIEEPEEMPQEEREKQPKDPYSENNRQANEGYPKEGGNSDSPVTNIEENDANSIGNEEEIEREGERKEFEDVSLQQEDINSGTNHNL